MVEGRTHKPVIGTDLCESCSVCVRGCPAEMIPEYRKETKSLRGALYREDATPLREEKKTALPPCRNACPVGMETREYARLISQGRFLEALDVIREDLPFPGIIGRICHHPCEGACLRQRLDEPVSLCALKRFVADYEVGRREMPAPVIGKDKGKKVAVIGGGPAGMTCSLDLRRMGYAVTLFEARSTLGGMLYYGVPPYRLPRDVLERESSLVAKAGVEFRFNTKVGEDITMKEIYAAFDAVFVGCGAEEGTRLGIPGEDAQGVVTGVAFLRQANSSEPPEAGERTLVIGGGNVAVDAALTAKRLGAREVRMVCLEKRHHMPAGAWEREQAREEGIRVNASLGPKRIIMGNGKVTGIEFARCTSVFDREGRFSPTFKENATRIFAADMVIVAIGQSPEVAFLKDLDGLQLSEGGWVKTDPGTLETTLPGVFAGGDIITGPRMAINAVADGKKAAVSIDRYLSSGGKS